MKDLYFLSMEDVLTIHRDQITRYGGALDTRDLPLLQSAIAMPAMTFDAEYLHKSPFEMAAAYLFHLCQNHPFVDGNKRTAAAAAIAFLYLNGIELKMSEEILEQWVRLVAQGNMTKPQLVALFEKIEKTPVNRSHSGSDIPD